MPTSTNRALIILICSAAVVGAIMVHVSNSPEMFGADRYYNGQSRAPIDYSNDVIQGPDSSFFNSGANNKDNASANIKAPAKKSQIYNNGVSAQAYLIGDLSTGRIYSSRNADKVLPIASISKLVTAIVTDELLATTSVTITAGSLNTYGAAGELNLGEKFTMREILRPLLLESSNAAAETLADAYGRVPFIEKMAAYGWEIGMPSTYFADPSGLDPHNVSTARELFVLAGFLYRSHQDILAITREMIYSVATTTDHASHVWKNIHPFVDDPRFIGGKTGRTPEAGDALLTILDINNQPIAFIVLGSDYDARAADTKTLIGQFGLIDSLLNAAIPNSPVAGQ